MRARLSTALTLTAFIVGAGEASAQGVGVGASLDVERISPQKLGAQTVFVVKFLCGTIPPHPTDPQASQGPLAPGTYMTAINLHRVAAPSTGSAGAQTYDFYVTAGGLVNSGSVTLLNLLQTTSLPCGFILPGFDPLGPFVEGMVTITATLQPKSLANVVAVYTFKNVDGDITPPRGR